MQNIRRSEQAQISLHLHELISIVALKCSFEVVCLIASVDHLFGLLLEHVVLAVCTRLTFWLGLAACSTILRTHLYIFRVLYAAEKSSNVVLLVAVVEEGDFGLVGGLRRNRLLLHGRRL